MIVTEYQLQRVCVGAPAARVSRVIVPLNEALDLAGATTPLRAAMFLAQTSHECGDYGFLSELWGPTPQQLRYDPPTRLATRLGNLHAGDGFRYRGRGIIQLTGRANFRAAGLALGLPLEERPDLAALPEHAFAVGAWFWRERPDLNRHADEGSVQDCAAAIASHRSDDAVEQDTRIVNGGLNGLLDRHMRYDRACEALGIERKAA